LLPPILIRPQDATAKPPTALAEELIQQSLEVETLTVVGIGSAIPHACSTVAIASEIAKVHVRKILLDYVETPVIGPFEAIFLFLTTRPTNELRERVAKLETELKVNAPGPGGQVVLVSKLAEVRRITMTCLYKMKEFELIKINAAGLAISSGVSAALQLVRLSREPVRIEAVVLESIKSRETGKPTTAMAIYVKRGKPTEADADLVKTLHDLKLK
jgi:hypothetical protein